MEQFPQNFISSTAGPLKSIEHDRNEHIYNDYPTTEQNGGKERQDPTSAAFTGDQG